MSNSPLTQHLEDNAVHYNDLAKGPGHDKEVNFNRLYNLATELTSNLAMVSRALDDERANRVRIANAVVGLAEHFQVNAYRYQTDTEGAYYQHLIDAILDLTK